MKKLFLLLGILGVLIFIACSNVKADVSNTAIDTPIKDIEKPSKNLSESFKKYWYAGEAEISSYQLEQARYGEIRKGIAVLIFVTEDFLPKEQVKADRQNPDNIPVLKLNATKKFNTGIYPYSIMQSTFYPVSDNQHAIKVSSSMQEWCGHVYAQLNNREQFEVTSHSYFQNEADQEFSLNKAILENELWTRIRINPDDLPTGNVKIIPSLEFSRLRHKAIKAYSAKASLKTEGNATIYSIEYPELNRNISITFNSNFPFEIENWTETFRSGFGPNARELTTRATKIKQIKSAYWGQNRNKDEVLREELGL
ncbi:septum formation inhibitor Maf [Aquimarina gracilis]|uniref:Septum formation inhibitor Maf n=1 Tax=Aquimarina gracilis TaxID=874422 RepID=A0ABU6A296_9FLAO|nr:septum formation inhibitor Maf [Aquimarina gracilis]MEB3348297.1 septum formation inhibitor Maf [Aquimarina gracilis]